MFARIVEPLLLRQPELADRMVRRIRREIAFYQSTKVVDEDDLNRSMRSNLEFILSRIVGDDDLDLGAPDDTGRRRAIQGVPLADLLGAYRLSFSVIWAEAGAIARSMPEISVDDIIQLAARMFELHERSAGAAVHGYRDESRALLRTSERERAVLVEVILAGTASSGTLWQAAQTLNLALNGFFLVVAAESSSPGQDPLPTVESALSVADIGSVWRLEATTSLGVLSATSRPRIEAALGILNRQATGRIGLSPVFFELGQAGWARRLAQLALEANRQVGVRQFPDSPLDTLVAAAPDTALGVARTVLKDLLDLPAEDRDQLLDTLQAWLDAGGSARDAAATLFCHPNTVRYRLRRIESFTGRDLANPAGLAEVVAAARAWVQLPHHRRGGARPAPTS